MYFIDTGYGSIYPDEQSDDEASDDSNISGAISREDDDYFEADVEDEEETEPTVSKKSTRHRSLSKRTKKKPVRGNSARPVYGRKIPEMRNHLRKNKKVPGTVRKPTNDNVILMKSSVKGRPDVIFFSYPAYVGKEKESTQKLKELCQEDIINRQLVFKISETTNIYNSVVNSCKNAGMYLADSGKDWNLLFTGFVRGEQLKEVHKYQRINHFPCSYEIGRKDKLWKNIARMKRKFGLDYNICPPSYVLPIDYRRFTADFKAKENSKAMWIMKPCGSSCGKGIKILSSTSKLPKNKKNHLISRYISKPHLINGHKYDMRIYILVVSYDPLVIYMYKDGLVRFSTEKYSLKAKNLNKQCVHLTNYSINKKADGYVKNQNKGSDDEGGAEHNEDISKWSYNQLKNKLISMGADWEQVDAEIKDVIIKTIISVEPYIVHQMNMNTKHKNV